jgi:hypothetical protein
MRIVSVIAFCFVTASASYGEFCSQWGSVKACAELGCVWDDSQQVCRDRATPVEVVVPCDEVSSPEACDARVECRWDWDHCRSR